MTINLPADKSAAILMRHAEREAFAKNDLGNNVNITSNGKKATENLAKQWNKKIENIYTSPVKRCIQTANIFLPYTSKAAVVKSNLLGDPGIFINDCNQVNDYFMQYSPIEIAKQLISELPNPQGFCLSTNDTVYQLINFLLSKIQLNQTTLFITHDIILAVVLGIIFPEINIEELWPDYLEGLIIYKNNQHISFIYRQYKTKISC